LEKHRGKYARSKSSNEVEGFQKLTLLNSWAEALTTRRFSGLAAI
jgi:hypothetical protein